MTDLTKEEQAFFVGYEYWDETRGMQPIAGGDWYWADEVNEVVTALQKRIAELEEACRLALTALYYDPDFVDGGQVTRQAIDAIESVISEGGGEVSDE